MSALTTLTSIKKIESPSLETLSSPLLNMDNRLRLAMFRNKKECGTTIPSILYYALKLKFIVTENHDEEPKSLDKELKGILRNLLSDIQTFAADRDDVLISKTFQEIIFRHIVWGDPLMIRSESDLIPNDKKNRAHTVSGSQCPSCSIPAYLCRWLLEKDGLNVNSDFVQINSYVKRVAKDVHGSLSGYNESKWKKETSFSRRVHNQIFYSAFSGVFKKSELTRGLTKFK